MKNFQDYLEVVNEAKSTSSWERWKKQFDKKKAKGQEFLWINSSPLKQNEHLWQPQGVNAEKVYGSAFVWGSGSSTDGTEGLGWNIKTADFIAKAKNATVVNNKIATIKVPLINPDSDGNKEQKVKVFYGTVENLISVLEN